MGLMQHLAKTDFERYLHDKQSHYLEAFAGFLTSKNNWQRVLVNPDLLQWYQQKFDGINRNTRHRQPRLVLLNKQKQTISSNEKSMENAVTISLMQHGKIDAYIAIKPPKNLYDKAEKHFIKQLKHNFFSLAISLIIAAAIASLVISRQLLKPIMAISKACEALKNKQWDYLFTVKAMMNLPYLREI